MAQKLAPEQPYPECIRTALFVHGFGAVGKVIAKGEVGRQDNEEPAKSRWWNGVKMPMPAVKLTVPAISRFVYDIAKLDFVHYICTINFLCPELFSLTLRMRLNRISSSNVKGEKSED